MIESNTPCGVCGEIFVVIVMMIFVFFVVMDANLLFLVFVRAGTKTNTPNSNNRLRVENSCSGLLTHTRLSHEEKGK